MNGLAPRFNSLTKTRYLMVDASACLSLGTLKGLENFSASVRPILNLADGLVCSPGQICKLGALQKNDASLLVRMDWNNTLRGRDFVLPSHHPIRVPILSAQDARDLGATAMVTTFLLGYEEEIEASCLKSTVQLALDGKTIGLPLIVEVQPTGDRISLPGKAVELGASYALEGGADLIVIPYPGNNSLQTIGKFVSVPWLLKPTSLDRAALEMQEAISAGVSGLWLDHSLFASQNIQAVLKDYRQVLSAGPEQA
jgi:DhnA family fructose-bisphosphate aldolase class Ia